MSRFRVFAKSFSDTSAQDIEKSRTWKNKRQNYDFLTLALIMIMKNLGSKHVNEGTLI